MRFFVATLLSLVTLCVFAQTPDPTQPQPSITIHWGAVTTMNDGTPIPSTLSVSYNLYGGHSATGPWSAPISILGTSTVRYGVAIDTDCYYVTAVVNGKESLPTTPACVTVTAAAPSTVPSAPTNLVITLNTPGLAPQSTMSQSIGSSTQ